MTISEKEILASICRDIENADDKIDGLERLYTEVKTMIIINKSKKHDTNK